MVYGDGDDEHVKVALKGVGCTVEALHWLEQNGLLTK